MVDPIFSAATGELYQFLALMDKEWIPDPCRKLLQAQPIDADTVHETIGSPPWIEIVFQLAWGF